MNIHCSACGAPLLQGSRFCPACALPLTAIAMPTPVVRKKPVSILAICVAAFGIFWIIAYTSDHMAAAHNQAAPTAPRTLTAAQIKADEAIDARFEHQIDAEIWNSPDRLRERLVLLAPRHDTVAQQAIARIETRLKELSSR
jgi:hypothetical protein